MSTESKPSPIDPEFLAAILKAMPKRSDPREPLIPIAPDARVGKPPCGECHLRPGERCDICGAIEAASDPRDIKFEDVVHNQTKPLDDWRTGVARRQAQEQAQ